MRTLLKTFLLAGSILTVLTLWPTGAVEANAFDGCLEPTCRRDFDCYVSCNHCEGVSGVEDGECEFANPT